MRSFVCFCSIRGSIFIILPNLECCTTTLAIYSVGIKVVAAYSDRVCCSFSTSIAIALHNMPEGMVIGASFAGGSAGSGWVMAAVIGLHNIPEGMAVSVPLAAGGETRRKAVGIAAMTGAPTVLGAVLGYCLGTMGPMALASALSFAAGAMLYVVFGELLPESAALWRNRVPALAAVAGILVGMMIVYG